MIDKKNKSTIKKKTTTISKASTKAKPKVSVVITVYNMEDYLRKCLNSIINQTLHDIEIICIDDSSEDSSYAILEEYAAKDSRIIINDQSHAGAGKARNKGISMATGEYLSVLDADDFYEPCMLENAYARAIDADADIVVFRCDSFDQKTKSFRDNNWSIIPERFPGDIFSAKDIPDKIFNIGAGWAWDKLFKKSFVDECGIGFQEIRTTNDMSFVLYLYTRASRISFLDEILAHQRINNKTSLSSTREESWDNVFIALKDLKKRLEADGTYEKYRQSFVNWSLNLLLWHIKTLNKKESDMLKAKCRSEYFDALDITGNDPDYFYDQFEYEALANIMEGQVKVSVIVPVYNSSAYLRRCLDSICDQTLNNIEIICVDDGSTDISLDILKEYSDRDYRFFVIEKEHSNAGEARNAGMKLATGEYLSFLDSDDFFELNMLETVYACASKEESDVCLFRSDQFDHVNGRFKDTPWTLRDSEMPEHRPFSAQEAVGKIFNMSSCTAWDKLFKKDYIFKNSIMFQSNNTSNDMLFTFTAMSLADRISTVDVVLAHQRVGHPKALAQNVEYCTSCFHNALYALKESLRERVIYEEFKQSYVNWAIDFSLFNMHAFKGCFSDLIRRQLKLKYFEDMDVYGYPEEGFYNHDQFNEMMDIMEDREGHDPDFLPKVSIIIPTYNAAHYLPVTLDSVVYQTLEDIEIICVDDGSTDDSLRIINDYADKDSRVIVLSGDGQGYDASVNKGLSVAKGEFVGIIRPGDHINVRMYMELYYTAIADHVECVMCDYKDLSHNDRGDILTTDIKLSGSDTPYLRIINNHQESELLIFADFIFSGIYKNRILKENEIKLQNNNFKKFIAKVYVHSSGTRYLTDAFYYHSTDVSSNKISEKETASAAYETDHAFSSDSGGIDFSIIIPVYNDETTITRCIDSVINQTYNNIEIIIVDDCSSDSSPSIIDEYAEKDDRIRVVHFEENRSSFNARKKGVQLSKGKYLMFADADDYLEPNACELLLKEEMINPADIIHFSTNVITAINDERRMRGYLNLINPRNETLRGKDIFDNFVKRNFEGYLWNKVFNSKLAKKALAFTNDEVLPKGQDKYFYWIMAYFAESYRGIPHITLYNYMYGTGTEGKTETITPDVFEIFCKQSWVERSIELFMNTVEKDDFFDDDIKRFFEKHNLSYEHGYSEALRASRRNLINHTVKQWTRLSEKDKPDGIKMLFDYWNNKDDANYLISSFCTHANDDSGILAESYYKYLTGHKRNKVRKNKVIGTYYHIFRNGGIQRVISKLTEIWLEQGYEVVLFTDEEPTSDDYPLPEGVTRVTISHSGNVASNNYYERACSLSALLKKNKIDTFVYHDYLSPSLLWDMMLCKANDISFVLYYHNVFTKYIILDDKRFYTIPPIAKSADAMVVLSDIDKVFWRNYNSNVHNVINPLTFDQKEIPEKKGNNKIILWCGRLDNKHKQYDDSVDIIKEVLKKSPDAKLFIVGSDDDHTNFDRLKDRIENLDLQDSVILCGYQKDITPFFNMASVYLMTSSHEGYPMSLMEAMLFGLPVVMYDLPYLTLTNGNRGVVSVPQKDVARAADKISLLLEDENLRDDLGKANRDFVEKLYENDRLKKQWENIFKSLNDDRNVVQENELLENILTSFKIKHQLYDSTVS